LLDDEEDDDELEDELELDDRELDDDELLDELLLDWLEDDELEDEEDDERLELLDEELLEDDDPASTVTSRNGSVPATEYSENIRFKPLAKPLPTAESMQSCPSLRPNFVYPVLSTHPIPVAFKVKVIEGIEPPVSSAFAA
jgi:hypothetical protein